ncbi:hypothetical protein GCM10019017_67750 [Streptomyces showdoensis]
MVPPILAPMPRPLFTAEQAVAAAREHRWEPEEEFPGAKNVLWKMRCMTCGQVRRRPLRRVLEGYGCWSCTFFLADPVKREKIVRDAGFTPTEPPHRLAATPWRCRCGTCGNEVDVLVHNITKGGGCIWCSGRRSPEELCEEIRRFGFEPRTPPPARVSMSWECTCLRCGENVTPILVNLRQRPDRNGCPYCSGLARITPEVAVQRMEERGATPLEDFQDRKSQWLMRCHKCGRDSRRQYKAVMRGHGCKFCDKQGFDWSGPAMVYVMVNEKLGAGKYGIASLSAKRSRFSVMRPRGWAMAYSLPFPTGVDAHRIEQRVEDILREDRSVPQFLAQGDLPQNGATETFSLSLISASEVWELVQAEAARDDVEAEQPDIPAPRPPAHTESPRVAEQLTFEL